MEGRQEQPQATGRKGGALGQVHANLNVTHVANVFRVLNVMVVADVFRVLNVTVVDSVVNVRVVADVDGVLYVTSITDVDRFLNVTVLVDVDSIVDMRVVVNVDIVVIQAVGCGGSAGVRCAQCGLTDWGAPPHTHVGTQTAQLVGQLRPSHVMIKQAEMALN